MSVLLSLDFRTVLLVYDRVVPHNYYDPARTVSFRYIYIYTSSRTAILSLTDTIASCWVHLINNGTTLRGDTLTIEWEGTGPGALVELEVPFVCKIVGINRNVPCK